MSASFSDTAFGKDTAFSSSAFEFGGVTPVIVVIDTHDGERKRRRDEEFKNARERLRDQIRFAIEGPLEPLTEEYAEPIFKAIEVVDTAQPEDGVEKMLQQMEALDALRRTSKAKYEAELKRRELQMRWDDEDNSDIEALML